MAEKPPSDTPKSGTDKPKTSRPRQRRQLERRDATDAPVYAATLSGAAQAAEPDRGADSREQKIRQRAYELWEQEGCPPGRADEYWHRAERAIASESADRS